MRIRLFQPPAGDWLAGAWAELGNIFSFFCLASYYLSCPVDEERSKDDVEDRNDQHEDKGGFHN